MKLKLMLCLMLFVVLLLPAVSGADITFTPGDLTLDLVGGDTVYREIVVQNNNNYKYQVNITTLFTPDGEGINVSYSTGSSFVLKSQQTITINMTIKTSMLLLPQSYIITTIFNGTKSKVESKPTKPDVDSFYSPVFPQDDEPFWKGQGPEEKDEEPDDKPELIVGKAPESGWVYIVVFSLIILLIISLLILYTRKKEK